MGARSSRLRMVAREALAVPSDESVLTKMYGSPTTFSQSTVTVATPDDTSKPVSDGGAARARPTALGRTTPSICAASDGPPGRVNRAKPVEPSRGAVGHGVRDHGARVDDANTLGGGLEPVEPRGRVREEAVRDEPVCLARAQLRRRLGRTTPRRARCRRPPPVRFRQAQLAVDSARRPPAGAP